MSTVLFADACDFAEPTLRSIASFFRFAWVAVRAMPTVVERLHVEVATARTHGHVVGIYFDEVVETNESGSTGSGACGGFSGETASSPKREKTAGSAHSAGVSAVPVCIVSDHARNPPAMFRR